jgi:hypothetical protein
LKKVLRLDSRLPPSQQLVLRQSAPSLAATVAACLKLSNQGRNFHGSSSSETLLVKLQALRLLPYLLPGVSARAPFPLAANTIDDGSNTAESADQGTVAGGASSSSSASSCSNLVLEAVDELVATHFPLKSHEQPRSSAEESAYHQLLSEAFAVVSRSGCLDLLERLQVKTAVNHSILTS